jgi:hypothetical protein
MSIIVCLSRCLICGRRTPHEVCHRHSIAINGLRYWPSSGPSGNDFNRNQARMYKRGFYRDAEECSDPACPALNGDTVPA